MSEKPLVINGKSFISSRRAAEIFGYTTDYVGQLARAGKIESTRMGRDRYIDYASISTYVNSTTPNGKYPKKGRKNGSSKTPLAVHEPVTTSDELDHTESSQEAPQDDQSNEVAQQDVESLTDHSLPTAVHQREKSSELVESEEEKDELEKIFETKYEEFVNKEKQAKEIKSDKYRGLVTTAEVLVGIVWVAMMGLYLLGVTDDSNKVKQDRVAANVSEYVDSRTEVAAMSNGAIETLTNVGKKSDEAYIGFLKRIEDSIMSFLKGARNRVLAMIGGSEKTETQVVTTQLPQNNVQQQNPVTTQEGTTLPADIQENLITVDDLKTLIDDAVEDTFENVLHEYPEKREGIVVAPMTGDEEHDARVKQRVKDSFSDEVKVSVDEDGTAGVIEPVFRSPSDDRYFFVIVPVDEDHDNE